MWLGQVANKAEKIEILMEEWLPAVLAKKFCIQLL
jgi:hypothetical protein